MDNNTDRQGSWRSTAGAAIAGLVILSGLACIALANEGTLFAHAGGEVLEDEEASNISTLFTRPQTAADRLPAYLRKGEQAFDGVQAATSRTLGEARNTSLWIALNDRGEACLIVALDGEDQLAAMTCQTGEAIARTGLAIQSADRDQSIRVYFVPTGYVITIPGYEATSAQSVVGDATEAQTEVVAVVPDNPVLLKVDLPSFEALEIER